MREPRSSGREGIRGQIPSGRWDAFWLLGPGCCGSRAGAVPRAVPRALCPQGSSSTSCHGQAPQPSGPQGWFPGGKAPLCRARVDQWLCSYRMSLSLYLLCWGFRLEVGMASAQGLAQGFAPFSMVRHTLIRSCSWALLC